MMNWAWEKPREYNYQRSELLIISFFTQIQEWNGTVDSITEKKNPQKLLKLKDANKLRLDSKKMGSPGWENEHFYPDHLLLQQKHSSYSEN